MKNVIENLERYYKSLLSQEQDLDFFLCLADYINFINQTPKTKEITDYLYRIAEKRTENLENQTKEIIKELNDTRKKLTNKIEKQGVKYEELRKIHKYFLRLFEKQSDLDGDSLISLFSGYIQCLLKSLYKNGYKEIVKEFATEKGNALKFNFLDKINHYSKEKNTYENDQITELWGAWQKLKVIQLEEIKEDRYSGFKKENYIGYATRIHNHLIEKLSKLTNQKKEKGELSTENLERIQKVLKIILDALEIQGINRLVDNKILIKKFEREGVFYEEVISILNKINNEREKPILEVLNESIDYQELRSGELSELERLENENIGMKFLDISREDLDKNIILRPKNLNLINILRENKEGIDGELKKRAEAYAKEIRRAFKEEERIREIAREEQDKKDKIKITKMGKRGTLITRDRDGGFYYKNKPIKFKNKEAIYYLIFECLYEKADLNGFCSYETINKYLVEHGKEEYTDERQMKDRIKNGIMNLFRFSNLPLKAPDGKELIQKIRGKGIILYNPSF